MAKSKFFRVATEGATTDGRTIQRGWIEQMARNYNRAKYGARVFLEHIRGLLPDSPFRAYGDVLALEAREVEDGKLALFAQIEPTDDLIALTKARQKIFTSIEVNPKFADTGEPYLTGLGVTDTPASLGTEVLAFAAQNPEASPFRHRKQAADNLFSAAEETSIELEAEDESDTPSLLTRMREMFGIKSRSDERRFTDIEQAVEAVATHATEQGDTVAELSAQHTELANQFAAAKADLDAARAELTRLAETIAHTAAPDPARPTATGGNGGEVTDC